MRKNPLLEIIHLLPLLSIFIVGCSTAITAKSSAFPLNKETTWVYSYEAYESKVSDPNQIIESTYQLTGTVIETETISSYFVAHVKREHELVNADVGWTGVLSSQPNEFWYVVNDNQVFQSNQPLDDANIKIDELILDYEFPLSVKKTWCWLPHNNPKDPKKILGCEAIGRREVESQGPYKTLAGNFDDCYDMINYLNGGNIFQKLCSGVGIVSIKFDHAGTRFGLEQTLIRYSVGAP